MSRILGFLAGVTTGSSMLYLFGLEIKNNAAQASQILKKTSVSLEQALKPKEYKITEPVKVQQRSDVGETMKDLWNEEVVKGATWTLNFDFGKWTRESFNSLINKLVK
ncbi:hypothetical protein V1511DRAFT_503211 [Dipodascopsis uninucleata]